MSWAEQFETPGHRINDVARVLRQVARFASYADSENRMTAEAAKPFYGLSAMAERLLMLAMAEKNIEFSCRRMAEAMQAARAQLVIATHRIGSPETLQEFDWALSYLAAFDSETSSDIPRYAGEDED